MKKNSLFMYFIFAGIALILLKIELCDQIICSVFENFFEAREFVRKIINLLGFIGMIAVAISSIILIVKNLKAIRS
ncbi:hypothetical protein IRP63_11315 [Clostridium botulinum]|uniref:Uncharacterized protein n=1 Tax=Clostridium botulinum C/D str. DC5 TaxID=1443128 RepID=A0A0A0ILK6_CLOBO|nr:hypothetical protein [Clostridium botulinum]KGM95711.1 hypothetical protein Z956_03995 [Clostridium botulinum D str. CCUG 7971]KGN00446.1 hypothetical protein Z955_03660 [Clostridium botulinum C/D str. DC5]KOC48041.1 hypothetical protein ADU88_08860 [Clostridium botulinum]KOC52774.1 hypothetical protein ADU89_10340 [Clostridium botulinum]KOC58208.1 hypothetical protein ADU90_01470 [Clostridium botulinum]